MKKFKILFFLLFPLTICLSCGDDDGEEQMEQMEEEVEITLEGDYRGTWDSTTDMDITYDGFPISAKFRFAGNSETRLSGEFFATSNFSSCCSDNANDGTMFLDLDGDTITDFDFNDTITDCTGTFSGTGSIISNDPYTLEINFTGNDCDGNHIGQMIFIRVNN